MTGTNKNPTILLGEDDFEVRNYLETALKCQGYSVEIAEDGEEVLSALQRRPVPVSAVILDVILPRKDGLEALKEIRRFDPVTPIIMIDGAASRPEVVQAMKSGANDFLAKPINPEDLRRALSTALSSRGSAGSPAPVPAAASDRQVLFGTSPQMLRLQQSIDAIGWSDTPVLILGETGVGKEMFAREIHARSPRAKKPILKLNCAALPSELVESELFGYERGAFTGAFQKKPGMFELADGATILLDEIGDMDFKLQAKLLQVLQDQEFQRLGGKDTIRVDVRIIAATHRDLKKAIAKNAFREDLYYRLNVINVRVPALRDRKEDIIPLAEFLIRKHTSAGTACPAVPTMLQEVFLNYHWPGNVRELENAIRKFLVLRDANGIEHELRDQAESEPINPPSRPVAPPDVTLPAVKAPAIPVLPELNAVPGPVPVLEQLERAKREADRSAILAVLKSTNWNRRLAAAQLHIAYKSLLYKMKGLSIKKEKPCRAPQPTVAASTAALNVSERS
jgi:two-component system response regulator AtoC